MPVTGKVTPKMTDANPEARKLVSVYKSPTLADIIYYTNQHSDNGLVEALLKTVGFQSLGDQTTESGRKVVTEHLKNEGFDMLGLIEIISTEAGSREAITLRRLPGKIFNLFNG
ncbi:D-alanyl-D-alanine carboxypeptidase [Exiguobacterium sp. SL14]|nr:D-alanyl-D-alanine carboxypeptidase [Exiguobacterium sp. SL14]